MPLALSSTADLKSAIVRALENAPDDGSVLLASFQGAGGPFGDEIDPNIEIKGFGPLPPEISEDIFKTLKAEHALKFPPEFEEAHKETLAHEAFVPGPKVEIQEPEWRGKVDGILQRLNVQDIFNLRFTGLLISRHGTPATAVYCNPSPEVGGAIVVVLPNPHQGGQVTTRHGSRQDVWTVDSTSGTRYNYMAWLQNCFVDVSPLVSGFRVALAFDILYKVPPPFTNSTKEVAELQEILRWWIDHPQSSPKQLVYYLEDPFEMVDGVEDIPPMALSQMTFFRRAGESIGFQTRIGCLSYTVKGTPSQPEAGDSTEDISHADFAEILQERMQLEDLRGPDGLPSPFNGHQKLDMDPVELLEYLPKELFDGETEKPEETRQITKGAGSALLIEKVFRCNVLVILPPNRHV